MEKTVRLSRVELESDYQASKWLDLHMLLHPQLLDELLKYLGDIYLVTLGGVVKKEDVVMSHEQFLTIYSDYYHALEKGIVPKMAGKMTLALALSLDAFYAIPVDENRVVVKILYPVIQVTEHLLHFSKEDGKFRSTVFGKEGIPWGLTFSIPQLFVNPESFDVEHVLPSSIGQLFKKMQQWMRLHTQAVPLIVEGKKQQIPARIDSLTLQWINHHPILLQQGLQVDVRH